MKTDKQIQEDVMEELVWEPELEASEIGVAVKNGIVTLSGQVNTYAKKIAAEKAAKRVKEVKGIAEDIIVRLSPFGERTDVDIASSALTALKWNTYVPDHDVKVKVEDGWITLEGEVEWEYQKKEARRAVETLTGVKGVTNLLTIIPRIKTPVVKDAIKRALERSADVEADQITVDSIGSKVTLSGKVRTWSEKVEVERAAWSAPGVTEVESKLTL